MQFRECISAKSRQKFKILKVSNIEELRRELRTLYEKHWRGDIPKKKFDRLQAEKSVALYRAIVEHRLEEDEKILLEHHVVRAHLKLSQSVLKEPEQEVNSLFLTQRRLLRLRSSIMPGQVTAGDASDQTVVDDVQLSNIHGLKTRKELRTGEIIAGAVICGFSYLFRSWLMVTGSLLFLLGALGILHGLLLPTRWLELEIMGSQTDNGIKIYALRRKSGRLLVRALREHMLSFHNAAEGM
jgi:hypothetical protein